jgi:hypothetical protein
VLVVVSFCSVIWSRSSVICVLWHLGHPDKFDMYSVGILFLQVGWMCFL